jgi:hypothetical protein
MLVEINNMLNQQGAENEKPAENYQTEGQSF